MNGLKKERPIPKIGDSFKRKWKDKIYEMCIVKEGNSICYKVDDKIFSSPSGAAKYITNQPVNGWRFWKI